MSFSNDLTIIIATHERALYLKRVLEYYKDISIKIIIVDSSHKAYADVIKNSNMNYIHCPELSYPEKLIKAINSVKTEFITICADDDFIVKRALGNCVNFLKQNPSYELVQGYILNFTNINGQIRLNLMYEHTYKYEVASDKSVDRIKSYYNSFVQTAYVVRRKETYLRSLDAIVRFDVQGKLMDQTVCLYSVIQGKMKVLPIFFGVREYLPNSASSSWNLLEDLHQDKLLMRPFYDACAEFLSEKTHKSIDESRKIIIKIYGAWVKKRGRSKIINNRVISIFRVMMNRYFSGLPFNKLNKFGIRLDRITGELRWLSEEDNSDLNEIKILITKHDIKSTY